MMRERRTLLCFAATCLVGAGCAAEIAADRGEHTAPLVGEISVSVPYGKFALLANPFDHGDNRVGTVLGAMPIGTSVYVARVGGSYMTANVEAPKTPRGQSESMTTPLLVERPVAESETVRSN